MYQVLGPVLRRVGLIIEVLCILALLSVSRGKTEFWQKTGLDPVVTLRIGLGIGILVWTAGTILIVRSRRGPR
jgi:hypothetical protein